MNDTPLPDPSVDLEQQSDQILLAMLIFGEARGEREPGMLAVANVVKNRVIAGIYGGDQWAKVILKPYQFSCFLESDPNRAKLLEPTKHESPQIWDACWKVADDILNGLAKDNTQRATHYFVNGITPPGWSYQMIHTVNIGKHCFYRDPRAFRAPTQSHFTADLMGGE